MHWDTFDYCLRKQWGLPQMNKGVHAEAADKLAEALKPLEGHAPEDPTEGEVALRMKSAQDTKPRGYPARGGRGVILSVDDFGPGKPFPFGIKESSAALRKLADAIDASEVAPQRVEITQAATLDDFSLTTLTFVYADKQGATP